MIAGREAVRVEAHAGARLARTAQQSLGQREIVLRGDLHIGFFARDDYDLQSRQFGQRHVVGRRRSAAWSRCAARIASKRKPCGVCARKRLSRGTVVPVLRRLRGAAYRRRRASARRASRARFQRRDHARDQCGRNQRARRIVDQHEIGLVRRQRFQSRAHRILPRRAAGHRRQQVKSGSGGA